MTAAAVPSAVGACEACGALARPSLSLHWVPHLKAVLCCDCTVRPLKLWVTNRLARIASGVRPWSLLLVALLLTGCGGGLAPASEAKVRALIEARRAAQALP